MIATKNDVDLRISELEEELKNVKGSETEKYARIVGYYRAVKNWNLGKKEEFKARVNFTNIKFDSKTNGCVKNEGIKTSTGNIASYKFFYRTTCPNCPPVKNIISGLSLNGESINADTSTGFTKAAIFSIYTAPTVVFLDKDEKEVTRATNTQDIKKILAENNLN
jgi:hypothetical protein